MILSLAAAFVSVALAGAEPAASGDAVKATTSPAPAAAKAAKRSDGDRMVCKSQPVTGTRFAKRVCRTAAEWTALSAESRQVLENQQSKIEAPSGN
jgi:hypothetical protein